MSDHNIPIHSWINKAYVRYVLDRCASHGVDVAEYLKSSAYIGTLLLCTDNTPEDRAQLFAEHHRRLVAEGWITGKETMAECLEQIAALELERKQHEKLPSHMSRILRKHCSDY